MTVPPSKNSLLLSGLKRSVAGLALSLAGKAVSRQPVRGTLFRSRRDGHRVPRPAFARQAPDRLQPSSQRTQAVALSRLIWNLRVPANPLHGAWHFTAFCQRIAHQQSVEPASGDIW